MFTNCVAIAKVVVNKKLNTLRLVVTFDKSTNSDGKYVIAVRNAAYASGDICNKSDSPEYIDAAVTKALNNAKSQLRTNNIVMISRAS